MTSIDQAFRKAYAKKVPAQETSTPTTVSDQQTAAVWIDENTGKNFRNDDAHGIAAPHLNRPKPESHDSKSVLRQDEPHASPAVTKQEPTSNSVSVVGSTTAYDAWTEKLEAFRPEPAENKTKPEPKITTPQFTAVWELDNFQIPSIPRQFVDKHLSPIGTQLERASREGLQTLAICSQERGTGRTTTSIAIAEVAANSGLRVALVDGDVEGPSLVDKLRLDMPLDWVDAIEQGLSVEEATVQSLANKMCLIPLLNKDPAAFGRVDEHAKALVDKLRLHFDLIVIDFGPLSKASFGLSIPLTGELVDAVIMVEDMSQTDKGTLESYARRIRAVGIDNIGLIENFVTTSEQSAAA